MTLSDLDAVLRVVPTSLLIFSPTFEVVAVSDAFLSQVSIDRSDVLGMQADNIFVDEAIVSSLTRVSTSLQSERVGVAEGALSKGSRNSYCAENTAVLNREGKLAAIMHHVVTTVLEPERIGGGVGLEKAALMDAVVQRAFTFDATLSSITDFVYVFDGECRFAYANNALLQLWGETLDRVVGKDFFDLGYPRELAAKLTSQIQHVFRTGEIVRDETAYTSPAGAEGYYEYILCPVRREDGSIELVAGSTRDITQRKQSEQERERLQEQNAHLLEAERAARSEAERLGHAKDEFLATLSHELRTPLHAILGWTQLLRRRQHDAKSVDEGMDIIERNAHLQRQLIEDLLDMSRISSGKARLKMQQMCTKDVAEAAVRSVQPAASAKRITVTSRLHPEGLVVRADPGRIQQVLWNLLSNSIKFTPEGGWVEVGEERVGDQLHLYVRDSGRGIDAEFLPHVFERFRQSDASTTRRYGGLGLGLAIVKSLVEMHGGRVSVESDGKDLGSTFHVVLPSSRVEDAHTVSIERTESSTGTLTFRGEPQLLRGVKVLVVDDEEDGRNFVGRIIRECAADVMLASSAREALEIFSTFAPHVLISDIGMPDVDGYELMRRIRALGGDSGGSIPSAALTAFARLEDRTRALMAGYHTHLAKPIDANELVATVASLAGRTGAPV